MLGDSRAQSMFTRPSVTVSVHVVLWAAQASCCAQYQRGVTGAGLDGARAAKRSAKPDLSRDGRASLTAPVTLSERSDDLPQHDCPMLTVLLSGTELRMFDSWEGARQADVTEDRFVRRCFFGCSSSLRRWHARPKVLRVTRS